MIPLSRRPSVAILLGLCGFFAPSAVHSQDLAPEQADRVFTGSPSTAVTRLAGHIPAWASAANDAGPAPDTLPVRLSFVLTRSPERQAAFTRLLEDQQNPASPSFHKWLSPQQAGSLYGPTQHDLAAFTAWLTGQGFTIAETAPSGIFVTVDASAATAAKALGTSFHSFRVHGESRLSATTEPSIPSQFAAIVGSISGLSQLDIEPMHHAASLPMSTRSGNAAPQFTSSNSGSHFITPGDFATIFDLKSVYSAGITGSGQKVAIIGRSRVATTDISEFESATGLTANLPNVVIPTDGVDPGITGNGDQGEATLDVDRVIGTAPAVQADLVVSGSANGYNGIYVAAQYEVQHLLDPVMNISFGSCELYAGPGGVSLWDTLFSQAASEGISVFVSSADSGAATCEPQFSPPDNFQFRAINYICASSYATCVGATEPADQADAAQYWSSSNGTGLTSALGYIPEGAWNEPISSDANGDGIYVDAASGGGASIFVPKPAWQTGTGVPADGARDVPDVSFPGAAHDGYFACYANGGGDCANNYFEYFSGTSAAAPAYAAVTALLNQKTSGSQGNLNPLLYRIAASTPAAFHDATPASSGVIGCGVDVPSMCNNSTPSATELNGGLVGFALTTGYDQVTGLGSLDIANFLTAAAVPVHALAATQLAVGLASPMVPSGQTEILTATLTSTTPGTPSGTVQFYSDGTALGAPVTLTAGTATTAALPFNSAGSFFISAVYSGDSTFAAATAPGVSLTVTGAASTTQIAITPSTVLVDSPVSFSATISPASGTTPVPTGIVRFYLTSSSKSGYLATAPLVNGTAVTPQFAFPIDNYTLQTFYLGDTVYSPTQNSGGFTPQKLATQTQLSGTGDQVGVNGSFDFGVDIFDLTANSAPTATGTIQLYSNGTPLGSAFAVSTVEYATESSAIAFTTPGTYSITAVYSGDVNRQSSTSAAYSLTVLSTPASFEISSVFPTLSVTAGATTSNTDPIIVSTGLGFIGNINFACSVAFQGTGTATSPPTCSFGSQSSITVTLDNATPNPVLTIGTTAPQAVKGPTSVASSIFDAPRSRPGTSHTGLLGGLSLASAILLVVPVSLRRRWRGTLLAVLFVPFFVFLSGCGGGGGGGSSTPPPVTPQPGTSTGNYTITVTATTTASGAPTVAPITIALTVK